MAPGNGTVGSSYSSGPSVGAPITPTGLYYIPNAGYSGSDSFAIQVTDCAGLADTMMVRYMYYKPFPDTGTIAGSSTVCTNGGMTLLGGVTTGGTWMSDNTAVATVNPATGVVTGVSLGPVNISYTLTNSCGSTTVGKAMTVISLPSPITVTTTNVCVGGTVTLTDPDGPGKWSSSNSSIATVDSTSGTVLGVAAAGVPSITYTSLAGCSVSTKLTINPLPATITGPASVCEEGVVTATETTFGGVWNFTGTDTSIATVMPGAPGVRVSSPAYQQDTLYLATHFQTGCMITEGVFGESQAIFYLRAHFVVRRRANSAF